VVLDPFDRDLDPQELVAAAAECDVIIAHRATPGSAELFVELPRCSPYWETMTPECFDDRINTNLRHYFFAIQALAPQMIDAALGSIINIGSSSCLMKADMFPGYAIAKSAVAGITRTMAHTFGAHGVRVNTVMPGWVPTERPLAKWWTPEGEQRTMDDQVIKRRILPDEFAQMVLFLAADDGAACTAQQFLVDGGRF